jgi:cysteine desulfurase
VARKGSRVLPRLLVGSTEHASIWGPIRALSELQLCEWTTVPVDTAGRPDLEVLSRLLPSCDGLFLMSANNETGVQTPLDGVSALVGDAGVPWHCDMVQSLGKAAVDLGATEARGITSAAFSAHKLGGPKGVGGLFARRGSNFISGMGQREIRPGTPNLSGALGFAAACAAISLPSQETVRGLREAWEEVLLAEFPGVQIHGRAANRLPNTTMASFKDPAGGWIDGEEVTLALAQAGVEVSTGAACSTGSGQPSHVLLAMGIPPEIAHASLRLSLGTATTHEDLAIFKHALRATLQPTS